VPTIRTILARTFLGVIFGLIVTGVVAFGLFSHASAQYRDVVERLVGQSRVINLTYSLIDAYNSLYKNVDDAQAEAGYLQLKSEVIAFLSDKKNEPVSGEARATYAGLGVIIRNVMVETDQGIESTRKGDITGTSAHYDEANRQFVFLKELASEHYARSLKDASALLPQIKASATRAYMAGAAIGVLALVGSLVYALNFSLSITRPITNLTSQAKRVAAGDFEAVSDFEASKTSSEIISLSESLRLMITNLKNKITQLDDSNKALEQSKMDTEHQAEVLRQMNDLMTGRELKMIELKKELEAIKHN
jgi:methyl-accepting chemotaxis protein